MQVIQSGNQNSPRRALIMIHGRGSNAQDIMGLSDYLNVPDYLFLGPEAEGNTWYPHSFVAPVESNQPFLDESLKCIAQAVDVAKSKGIGVEDIYLLGFSQGACLALEFAAQNAQRYGGIVALSGGLVGEKLLPDIYKGDFRETPVFMGSSDPDSHIPVARVHESAKQFVNMGAAVTKRIYPGMGHRITQQEIELVNTIIFDAV